MIIIILRVCTPDSLLLRRISYIFLKWIKVKKKHVCVKKERKLCADVEFLNALTQHEEQKVCGTQLKISSVCQHSAKLNQS